MVYIVDFSGRCQRIRSVILPEVTIAKLDRIPALRYIAFIRTIRSQLQAFILVYQNREGEYLPHSLN